MYNCIELKNLNTNPRINDISLDLLREYYETFLYPFEYHYVIKDDIKQYDLELRFDKENLSHLLGLESIVRKNLNREDTKLYTGINGWNNIQNLSITIDILKSINKGNFKNGKDKLIFFYLIPNLITSPKAIYFESSLVEQKTWIKSKIIFYNDYNNSIVHLGIEPNDEHTYYIPRTLLVERITPKNDGSKYIKGQQSIELSIKNRVIML